MLYHDFPKFNILDHVNKLSPVKGQKNKYFCPVCNSNNLSINSTTGAYSCYTCGDSDQAKKDIREALSPLAEILDQYKEEPKKIRPKSNKDWYYHTILEGNLSTKPLIKVSRTDDGGGKRNFFQSHLKGDKWYKGYGEIKREQIALYKINEINEAVSNGELIFVTEGEGCADKLWSLGLPATTNIGGSGKWLNHHSESLKGAKVCLVPDRDVPGIKHMERIEKDFPDAQYLYAFPDSKSWEKVPPDKGLDIVDWISDYNLSIEDILSKVEDKKREIKLFSTNNVIPFKQSEKEDVTQRTESLKKEIIDAQKTCKKESEIRLKIIELSQKYFFQSNEVEKLWKDLKQESYGEDYSDIITKLRIVESSKTNTIDINSILGKNALPLEKWSLNAGVRAEVSFTNLLIGLSSLNNSKDSVFIDEGDHRIWCGNLASITVGVSGSKKSPPMNTFIMDPLNDLMAQLLEDYYQDILPKYNQEKLDYDLLIQELKRSKDKEKIKQQLSEKFPHGAPVKPSEPSSYLSNVTPEGLAQYLLEKKDSPGLIVRDEILGLLNGYDKYGKNKSGNQDLIEFLSGAIINHRRRSGNNLVSSNYHYISINGNVQPDLLQQIMTDENCDSGFIPRFLFVYLPLNFKPLPDNPAGKTNIKEAVTFLYKRFSELSKNSTDFHIDTESYQILKRFTLVLESKINDCNTNKIMTTYYNKWSHFIGRFLINLAKLNAIKLGLDEVDPLITSDIMINAINLFQFYCNQLASFAIQNDESNDLTWYGARILKGLEKKDLTLPQINILWSGKRKFTDLSKLERICDQLIENKKISLLNGKYTLFKEGNPETLTERALISIDKPYQCPDDIYINDCTPLIDKLIKKSTFENNINSDTNINGIDKSERGYQRPLHKDCSDSSNDTKGETEKKICESKNPETLTDRALISSLEESSKKSYPPENTQPENFINLSIKPEKTQPKPLIDIDNFINGYQRPLHKDCSDSYDFKLLQENFGVKELIEKINLEITDRTSPSPEILEEAQALIEKIYPLLKSDSDIQGEIHLRSGRVSINELSFNELINLLKKLSNTAIAKSGGGS